MPEPRRGLALVPPAALVILAAALRFWALDYGLPHPLTRPDEEVILSPTLYFARGDLNPHYHIYPGLYLYLVWLWGEAGLALRRLVVATPPYPAVLLRDHPRAQLDEGSAGHRARERSHLGYAPRR